jgi:pimeloyl-ACP methyl ester carboxylesterase
MFNRILFAMISICILASESHALPMMAIIENQKKSVAPENPKTIVFIHGMFMTPKSWGQWINRFSRLGYTVHAPAWPLHDLGLEVLRSTPPELSKLTLAQVMEHYRRFIRALPEKPIVIGHSMGGLVAQKLLSEGLASAAVAIDSAPPRGVLSLSVPFIRANWGALNPFANPNEAIKMSWTDFTYAWVNGQQPSEQARIYHEFFVPESRRVGRGPLGRAGSIDRTKKRGPLLLIAGENDHIIPASLTWANYQFYSSTPGFTEFRLTLDRDHSTLLSPGWEQVAETVRTWLQN